MRASQSSIFRNHQNLTSAVSTRARSQGNPSAERCVFQHLLSAQLPLQCPPGCQGRRNRRRNILSLSCKIVIESITSWPVDGVRFAERTRFGLIRYSLLFHDSRPPIGFNPLQAFLYVRRLIVGTGNHCHFAFSYSPHVFYISKEAAIPYRFSQLRIFTHRICFTYATLLFASSASVANFIVNCHVSQNFTVQLQRPVSDHT